MLRIRRSRLLPKIEPKRCVEAILHQTPGEALGDPPPVPVNARVSKGNAAKVLIDLAGGDDFTRGGSPGLGGFAGLLLGSVSQHVVVVVVR
jgi:hypothetical protein